jgi:ATPase family associated with various cellular activities (AAA)
LPLPDRGRLRQIIDEVVVRISRDHTLQRKLDANGYDAVVESLRGLTEEESERTLSQALVARYALCPEIASDVLATKKAVLRRSEMLEFVEAGEALSGVGGMDNLKRWLVLRRGAWEDEARAFGLEPPHGVIILGVQGCGKSLCARVVAGEWNLPLVKFDTAAVYDKYIGGRKREFAKSSQLRRDLRRASSGSMNWKRCLLEAGPIQHRPTLEFLRGCWRRSSLGCRTAKPQYSWLPLATM